MTDSTMTEIPLVERLEYWAGDGHPHGLLHREAAAMLKAAVEALEDNRGWLKAFIECLDGQDYFDPETVIPELREAIAKIDNTLASLKQPGGR